MTLELMRHWKYVKCVTWHSRKVAIRNIHANARETPIVSLMIVIYAPEGCSRSGHELVRRGNLVKIKIDVSSILSTRDFRSMLIFRCCENSGIHSDQRRTKILWVFEFVRPVQLTVNPQVHFSAVSQPSHYNRYGQLWLSRSLSLSNRNGGINTGFVIKKGHCHCNYDPAIVQPSADIGNPWSAQVYGIIRHRSSGSPWGTMNNPRYFHDVYM